MSIKENKSKCNICWDTDYKILREQINLESQNCLSNLAYAKIWTTLFIYFFYLQNLIDYTRGLISFLELLI